jgi:hypothetical protein
MGTLRGDFRAWQEEEIEERSLVGAGDSSAPLSERHVKAENEATAKTGGLTAASAKPKAIGISRVEILKELCLRMVR